MQNISISMLEIKTSSLEQQYNLLLSIVVTLQIYLLTKINSKSEVSFSCKKCDFETTNKNVDDLNDHYKNEHPP